MTASLFDRAQGPETDVAPAGEPVGASTTSDDLGAIFDGLGGSISVELVLDAVAVVLASVLAVVVAFDLGIDGRWPIAVAFFAWVPGWTIVRAASFRATSLSVLTSIGLSVSVTMLVAQCLVAWGWAAWRPVTVVACLAVVGVLARDLWRGSR